MLVISDFETALHAALQQDFPNTRHQGCYFHFVQAVWRKIQALGLVALYNDDEVARTTIRKLFALALLPVAFVRNSFETLNNVNPALNDLVQYFDAQWLTRVPPVRWNCFMADNRTNNHVEGWNRKFNSIVRRHHENIWHFIGCLKEEESATRLALNQFAGGQVIAAPRNARYAVIEDRIARLKARFRAGDITVQEYWTGVSHLVAAN